MACLGSSSHAYEREYLDRNSRRLRRCGCAGGAELGVRASERSPGGQRTNGISREMVELSGIEPLTSSLRTKRSTN